MFHTGRCGSTVLADLLDQHTQIVWDQESVKPPLWRRRGDIRKFLQLSSAWSFTNFVGFETKFYHVRFHGFSLDGYVSMLKELGFEHFIVLRRRNYLRQVLSSQILKLSSISHISASKAPQLTRIQLNAEKLSRQREEKTLVEHFEWMDKDYDELEGLLSNQNILCLRYEDDIAENPVAAYDKICEYLSVEAEPVTVELGKGNPFALQDMIENFSEVEKTLSGTPYEWMLYD